MFWLILSGLALANNYYVVKEMDDCPVAPGYCGLNIGGMLALAGNGDLILVDSGMWEESLHLQAGNAGVILRSAGGASVTRLTTSEAGDGVITLDTGVNGVIIEGFTIQAYPRGIYVGMDASVELVDVVIDDPLDTPWAVPGRGVFLESYAGLTAEDTVFTGLDCGGAWGCGVYASGYNAVSLTGCTFDGNTAGRGGGLYADHGSVSSAGTRWTGNIAQGDSYGYSWGGALRGDTTDTTLDGDRFDGNTAGQGGAISLGMGTLSASDCDYEDNVATADYYGNNQGGAIASDMGQVTISGGSFVGNYADRGGALYLGWGDTAQLQGVAFYTNHAVHGAGLYRYQGATTASGLRFDGNQATDDGGGVYLYTPALTHFHDSVWEDNAATETGAAIAVGVDGAYSGTPDLTITDSSFLRNVAARDTVFSMSGGKRLVFSRNLVCENRAYSSGIVYAAGVVTEERTWSNNLFLRNDAPSGSGLLVKSSTAEHPDHVIHNTFLGQTHTGLQATDANVLLENNVFSGTAAGYGLLAEGTTSLTGAGTQLWQGNAPGDASGYAVSVPPDLQLASSQPLTLEDPASMSCGWYTAVYGGPLELADPASVGSDQHNPMGATPLLLGATGGNAAALALWMDDDGDGLGSAWDCDDGSALVGPTLAEVPYNGVDDDCDPATSDADADGDGYELGATPEDCDDTDPAVHPGATEVCNGVDDDCDGGVDEAPECACEALGSYGGQSFQLCEVGLPWSSAASVCAGRGQQLVVITSAGENAWLAGVIEDHAETWIGFSDAEDEGTWRWIAEPSTSFVGWTGLEPNDSDGGEDCAILDEEGAWNDLACAIDLPFVCEDPCPDEDGDGAFLASCGGTDCDDGQALVSGDLAELPYDGLDNDCDGTTPDDDLDGDGFPLASDCDDLDGGRFPEATELAHDGIDQDCDGADLLDGDGDGYGADFAGGLDCDDEDPAIHPGSVEVPHDGIDQDCDGADLLDGDGDGYDADAHGGDDCDDDSAAIHPGAAEVWYDGVDQDCGGGSDYDADGDGYDADAYGGDDCDDGSAARHPHAAEVWYDGVDQDCGGGSDYDRDGDGHDADAYGGDDCADTDAAVHSGAADLPNNGIDEDCSGTDLSDRDGDGAYALPDGADCDDRDPAVNPGATERPYNDKDDDCDPSTEDNDLDHDGYLLGDDCDDRRGAVHPGAEELPHNGLDDDCDPSTPDDDLDGDGYGSTLLGGRDCDDADAAIYPGAAEVWYDGVDQDCGGGSDYDQDRDGHDLAPTGDDCDDTAAAVYPGAAEVWYDGVDQDCDGGSDYDQDGDGYEREPAGDDCDDTHAEAHPGGTEVPFDGLDNDCVGGEARDADGDGHPDVLDGGDDCDDSDDSVYPDAPDPAGDGLDNNCDGTEAYAVLSGGSCDHGAGLGLGGTVLALVALVGRRRG
ncbi:MAG: hypothetical protein JXX28_00855 [Deltaproteobacteria bacterium]|nr:hypothetical protein [Deltaproteobacteria bacterium]